MNLETQQAKSNYEAPLQGNDEEEIEIPTYKEINNIISKLKGNKTPGLDTITSKLIKSGGYILILKIWNNGQIPEEWTEGIICTIFKKDDRRLCNNYRPIIHSFSILSDDRSKASSKTMPPHSAIQSLLLQMRISSPVLKVI